MIKNKKYYIDQINSSKANKFTEYWHYSHRGFKKAQYNLGIFRREDDLLVGVLQWGISAQEGIKLNRYVKEEIAKDEYLELNRFCMADTEGKNSESQAISLGIKWIKQNLPNIRLLVSYAGRKEGNYGYIYQCTNWEYLGYFISDGFYILDGQEFHKISLWYQYTHKAGNYGSFTEGICSLYNSIIQTWTKQFIYIQRLDKKLTPQPILPYPKPSNEFPIETRRKVLKDEPYVKKEYEGKVPIYYWEEEKALFSRAALIRRGEVEQLRKINKHYGEKVCCYDVYGHLIKAVNSVKEMETEEFKNNSIRRALDTGKVYKNHYFRWSENPEEEIEVPYYCIIDEIPFPRCVDAAAYLGVSKQAVDQAKKRLAKKVGGKEIFWTTGE